MVKNSCIALSIILFSCKLLQAGEDFHRDYTASTGRIISAETQENPSLYKILFASDGYRLNKDLCQNVLVSLGKNNKLFTCYSGYKKVDRWTICGGNYRRDPVIKETANILTETDAYTKVEYKFDDLPEICNEHPVNDIARWKNNYYIAHANNVYVYQSNNPWLTSLTLSRTHHLSSNAAGDIKKIFIDKDNNVIAVSSYGAILKYLSAAASSEQQIMPIISQSFPHNEKLYSTAYNTQNNMVLLGGHNFVHIVLLNSAGKTLYIPFDNLRINTIDTNDDYVLLSDIVENIDRFKIRHHKGHLEQENCCIEKQTPYEQWKECADCIQTQNLWKEKKEAWENEIIKFEITGPRKSIASGSQICSTYSVPHPTQCSHRISPVKTNTLIKSCRRNTITLLSLSRLLSAMGRTDHADLKTSELLAKCIVYNPTANSDLLTHTFLTKDFLFIGHHKGGRNPYRDFIYKIPLKDMQSTDINSLLTNDEYQHPKELFYRSDKGDDESDYYNHDCDYYNPLLINKTTEDEEKIVIIKTKIPCSQWTQGGCYDKEHWLQKIYDVILFTTKDQTDSSWSSYLIRLLKRNWLTEDSKMKLKALAFATIVTSPILFGIIAFTVYLGNEEAKNS